jgi:hypothetical protein
MTLFLAPQDPLIKRALSCPPDARIAALSLGRRDGAGDACGVLVVVAGHTDPGVSGRRRLRESPWLLRSRGPEQKTLRRELTSAVVGLNRLRVWVCAWRSIAPRRARVQLRGRPIFENALVILECNEAVGNPELSPWNDCVHLPRRLVRR